MPPRAKKQSPRTRRKPTAKKKSGFAARVSTLGEQDLGSGLKINLYGQSGTGKTTLWATFPKPIIVFVCSGGNQSGELKSLDTPEYHDDIHVVNIDSTDLLYEGIEYARQENFETAVVDHMSGLLDLCLIERLGLDQAPVQLQWGTATREQWGEIGIKLKEIGRAALALPNNVVLVAQQREFNTEDEGDLLMPYVASALTPSMVGWLNPAVDYICQTFKREVMEVKKVKVGKTVTEQLKPTGEVEYCLRTGPHSVYTTKFRAPKGHEVPDCIVDPDYDKIMEIIQG